MKPILIQTSDSNRYAKMLDVTSANTKMFCERHGLDHLIFKGLKRGRWDWHSMFNRIYIFDELIREGRDGWALYLDADAYIVDFDFPIKEYLESKSTKAGIVVATHVRPEYWDINSGVMFLNLGNPVANPLSGIGFRATKKSWKMRDMSFPGGRYISVINGSSRIHCGRITPGLQSFTSSPGT